MEVQDVISALHEQVESYRRLAKLAEIQHEHVQSGQAEALLDVLRMRQTELDRIGELDATISAVRKDWQAWMDGIDGAPRQAAQRLLEETRQLLATITTADRNDAMVLQQRKLVLGREIKQASSATAVNRKYVTAAYGKPAARMDVTR
jgi:hypothetical protein